ncbi:MAG: hypothetical protein M1365_08720 [Actinobacteria bacterium]|nr:hypothetical protein [Actinomycetota bacterium]
MNTIKDIIEKALEGIPITQQDKNILLGIYMLKYNQSCLELLSVLKGKDIQFQENINELFGKTIASLNIEERQKFNKAIDEEKGKILANLINKFKNSLSPQLQQKIEENLEEIFK